MNPVFNQNHHSVSKEDTLQLIKWFKNNCRILPWRTEFPRSPYIVWISEIMLQQTQVFVVEEYFNRWISRFPNIIVLASSTEEEVLEYWTGLGYYSRAKNILKTAKKIVSEYSSEFPSQREDILKLNGIGEYTVGAILSFAYLKNEPILDGNLKRFFSRFFGIEFFPNSKKEQEIYWDYARDWISYGKTEWINESLMELGAVVCLPKNPKCLDCPLSHKCYAYIYQKQKILPPVKLKKSVEKVCSSILLIEKGKRFLMTRKGRFLKGQLQFPQVETNLKILDPILFSCYSLEVKIFLGEFVHYITHHKITVKVFLTRVIDSQDSIQNDEEWIELDLLQSKINHSLGQKILKIIKSFKNH